MAIEAPSHAQRLDLHHYFSLCDIAMTMLAVDPGTQMSAVVEIIEIGQLMNPHPLYGHARRHTLSDGKQLFVVGPDQSVTIHASLNGGDIGVSRSFDLEMAIPAIHTQIAGVQLVAIWDRLNRTVSDIGVSGGSVVPE